MFVKHRLFYPDNDEKVSQQKIIISTFIPGLVPRGLFQSLGEKENSVKFLRQLSESEKVKVGEREQKEG